MARACHRLLESRVFGNKSDSGPHPVRLPKSNAQKLGGVLIAEDISVSSEKDLRKSDSSNSP